MLRIAFSKGKDYQKSLGAALKLLGAAGMQTCRIRKRYLIEWAEDSFQVSRAPTITGVPMRSWHIPELVARGKYDVGICGWDMVVETDTEGMVQKIGELSSPRVKVVLFCDASDAAVGVSDTSRGVILSEYPNITRKFFVGLGMRRLEFHGTIKYCRGSAESHIPDDYRYGVCISETGKTLQDNNQRVLAVLLESSTVMIANREAMKDPQKEELIKRLWGAMERTNAFAERM